MVRVLFRLLLIFAAVYAALSVVRGFLGAPSARLRPSTAGGRLVKDPVCGTYILEQTAIQARDQFFCSEECRGKFLAS